MEEKVTDIAAAILAGGKNSRMEGKNKAFLRVNGAFLIERTMKLLKEIFEEVIIVTNSPQDFKSYKKDAIIVKDIIRGAGPLGGIHSALSATSKKAVFFVACDMPFLHNDVILRQAADFNKRDCDCLVPRTGFLIEPLHAVYKSSLKDRIQVFLKNSNDYSVKSFLETINIRYLDFNEKKIGKIIFENLNTPQDVKEIGAEYESQI